MIVDLSTRDLACRLSHHAGLRLEQLSLPGNDWVDAAASPLFAGAQLLRDGLRFDDLRERDSALVHIQSLEPPSS